MKDESNIYLVGFMGSGKTSVGRKLAERMGWRFIDLDGEIERREGSTIREVFSREGESYFRAVEHEELKRVSLGKKKVVALGGGAFCSRENQIVVRTTGASIWLDAPMELMYARCSGDGSRPLFTTPQEMERLLARRRPHYLKANLRIDVGTLSVDDVAAAILEKLG